MSSTNEGRSPPGAPQTASAPATAPAGAASGATSGNALKLQPEMFDRLELIGMLVRLSDGRTGEVVHVEYEAPARVALVKTFPETPSPLTRAAVDRYSPAHLPAIAEILGDARKRR